MANHIIIPARLDSTRLPRKLLLSDTGMPMIWHTVRCAKSVELSDSTIVATDSDEIKMCFGSTDVVMTEKCCSGTERVVSCCNIKKFGPSDIIINLQGDEPELEHEYVDDLITSLMQDENCDVATLASLASSDEYVNPNVVKVVMDNNNHAMYFSRCSIPYRASGVGGGLKHVGVYAYRMSFLNQLSNMKSPKACHDSEKLEQLQWLENGFNIKVLVRDIKSTGIDTREEYDDFVKRWNKHKPDMHL
jgi:3-deoxy-manno-octulosonate cytidylyltransferase (CMP-KDO synthetase)